MKKIRMFLVGMNTCQRSVDTIEEALKFRPKWDFLDARLRKEYPLDVKDDEEEEEPETPEVPDESELPTQEVEPPVQEPETPEASEEKAYDDMSKPEKKDYLEEIARGYGVELDKRKKLEELEAIVDELLED